VLLSACRGRPPPLPVRKVSIVQHDMALLCGHVCLSVVAALCEWLECTRWPNVRQTLRALPKLQFLDFVFTACQPVSVHNLLHSQPRRKTDGGSRGKHRPQQDLLGDPHRLGTLCVLMVGLCRGVRCLPSRRRSLRARAGGKTHIWPWVNGGRATGRAAEHHTAALSNALLACGPHA